MHNLDISGPNVGTAITIHRALEVLAVDINEGLEMLEKEVIEEEVQEGYMRKNKFGYRGPISRKLCHQSES